MSPPAFGSEEHFPISPSKLLCLWIVLATAFALVFCFLYFPLWGAALAGICAIGSAIHVVRRDALLISPRSIIALRLGHSRLDYQLKTGAWEEGHTATPGSNFVSGWLSVVAVRAGSSKRHVILLPDSLGRESARRLRVWLRWSAVGNSGGSVDKI
jgi:hypothetical protein